MTFEQIQKVLSDIKYKNWFIELYATPKYNIRLSWFDDDSVTGKRELQLSREWYLNPEGITPDAIVQTVFKAIQNAEEHEVKEKFKYKGKRVFNPHLKLDYLLEVCENEDNI